MPAFRRVPTPVDQILQPVRQSVYVEQLRNQSLYGY